MVCLIKCRHPLPECFLTVSGTDDGFIEGLAPRLSEHADLRLLPGDIRGSWILYQCPALIKEGGSADTLHVHTAPVAGVHPGVLQQHAVAMSVAYDLREAPRVETGVVPGFQFRASVGDDERIPNG